MDNYNGDLSDEEAMELALSLSMTETAAVDAPAVDAPAADAPATDAPAADAPAADAPAADAPAADAPAADAPAVDAPAADASAADAAGITSMQQNDRGTAWGQVVEGLLTDYIKDVKVKKTENFEHLRVLCSSAEEIGEAPRKPKLDRGNLNSAQVAGLLRTRWLMYNRLIDLGAIWAEQTAHLTDLPRKLDGHHIAAAINLLEMPIRKEDTVLMMRVAVAAAEVEVSTRLDDEKVFFIKQFEQLMPLAKWPEETSSPASRGQNSGDVVREPLPAFDLAAAPREYYYTVDWPAWCSIFDRVRLRVEKNGLVW